MNTRGRNSSYRRTFGGQTAYSTAGSKGFGSRLIHETPIVSKKVSYSYSSSGGVGGSAGASMGISASGMSAGGIEGGFSSLKLNEKELLNGLNSRFASYVEKVRYLEEQNQMLEKKIREASAKKDVDLGEDKRENLRKLRAQIDDATVAKIKAEMARDNLRGEASELKWKLDFEGQQRQELDDELARLRKDVDDATMVRVDLERKIETLREELEYNRKIHDEEIEDLKKQIAEQGVNIEVDGIAPDVGELLRQIRAQYEDIVIQNRDEAEAWYKKKFEDLEDKAKSNQGDLEKVQGDIGEYRKQVTQLEMELESLRGTNDYLERNLADVEKRYESEVTRYQDRLARIGTDLEHATGEMKRHLAEYKRLMSVKLSLEKEIRTYRRLLEGEGDGKLSSSSSSESDDEVSTKTKTSKKVIIKTIETRDGKIVSSKTSEKRVDRSSESSSSSSDEEE
uniref:Intermediate filament protein D n=1 Tax=Styela clava TaxID=7725 RepID=Q9GVA1_STYCL|nr:glial fibrillary acidic protein-like [Styela clava]CAC04000.1 intermediate filament protein D [Styela clava]